MPKPYSIDLRERVIKSLQNKVSQKKTAEIFSISIESVKRWWKLFKENTDLKPKIPIITKPRKVDYVKVKDYIEANPDKTLKEVGDKFNIHLTASFYIFKKLGITYKKRGFCMRKEMKKKEKNL